MKHLFVYQTIASWTGSLDIIDQGKDAKRLWASVIEDIESVKVSVSRHPDYSKLSQDAWEDFYPMADIEYGMLFHSLIDPKIYKDQFFFQIEDPFFDFDILKRSFQFLVVRHSILRTSFYIDQFESPMQAVHKTLDVGDHIQK